MIGSRLGPGLLPEPGPREARLVAVAKGCRGLARAIEHLRWGRFREAAASFEAAGRLRSTDPRVAARGAAEALTALGWIRLQAGDPAGARAELERALERCPGSSRPAYLLARIHYRCGEPAEALARLQDAAAGGPAGVTRRLLQAACLAGLGRKTPAVRALDAALEAELDSRARSGRGHDARDESVLGEARAEEGRDRAPVRALRREILEHPDYPDLRLRIATLLLEAGSGEARIHLRAALGRHQNYVRARLLLGLACLEDGVAAEAAAQLERACEAQPAYPDLSYWLGVARLRAHDARASVAALERAVGLHREFARAHRALALAYHALGRTREAFQAVHRGLARDADSPGRYGAEPPGAREPESASEEWLCHAIALRSRHPDLRRALGMRLKDRGALHEARAAYRSALELHPGYAEAALELARVELSLGRPREAEALLARLAGWRPHWADAQALLGRTRLLLNDPVHAIRPLEAALRRAPGLVAARSDLAWARLAGARPTRAPRPRESAAGAAGSAYSSSQALS